MKKHLITLLFAMFWLPALAQVPTSGLIERFTFDNTLTGSAGTVLGAGSQANYTTDRNSQSSKAQDISSSTFGFNSAGVPNLPIGNADRSVCFWYKSNANGIHSLFNYGQGAGNNFAVAYVPGPDRLVVSNGSVELTQGITYTGNWTHVAIIFSSGTISMYINGAFQGTLGTITFATTAATPTTRIGYSPGGTYYGNFKFDDLLLYNRALTAQEVSNIYVDCTAPVSSTPTANLNICAGNTTTLSVTGSATFTWYATPTGGTSFFTGASYLTPVLNANTTYYVQAGTCATRLAIPVAVASTAPTIPTLTTAPASLAICGGNALTLNATATTGALNWYDVPTGGTSLASGNTFTTPILANPATPGTTSTKNYYVDATTGCNTSARLLVAITVKYQYTLTNTTPLANTVVCSGSATNLSVSGNAPSLEWTVLFGNGTVLNTTNTYTTPPLAANTIYSIIGTDNSPNSCDANVAIFVSVANATPAAAPINNTNIDSLTRCSGTSTTLSVSTTTDGIMWYDAPTGGNVLAATFYLFRTPVLTGTTTFYAQTGTGSCASPRTAITVNTISGPSATITLANDTIKSSHPYDNYILRKDGAVVSSGSGGTFAVGATQCGNYQAEYTNTVNNCNTMGVTFSRNFAPCGTYLSLSNVQFPVTYSYALGTQPGVPTTVQNQNQITLPFCTNAQLNVNIRSANGCLYSISFGTASLTNGSATVFYTSTSDTLTTCKIYSNIINIAAQGPTNTTASPFLDICSGFATNLSASGAGTLEWYGAATGGTVLGTGTTFATPILTTNTTYHVQSVSGGCTSTRTPISVVVNALPPTPVSNTPTANLSVCSGNSTVLSVVAPASGIATFWSLFPQGGNSFAIGTSVTIAASSLTVTDTFYVGNVYLSNNCNSPLIPIRVAVTPTPAAPVNTSGANQTVCTGNSTVLSATGTGTLNWYAAATGGPSLGTGGTFTTPVINGSAFYYVDATNNGCTSARTVIVLNVNQGPQAPTNTTPTGNLTICGGRSTNLTASTSFSGAVLNWYSNASGGASLSTGATFTTPTLTTTDTFYVSAETATCNSARTAIIVTVNALPTATISPATLAICNGAPATLTASGGTTYAWSNSGGSNAAATFTPLATTTYTVTVTNAANCSATATRSVTVNANPVAAITPTTASLCAGQSANLTASGGGTYSWSNTLGSTAAVSVSPATNTTYTVTVTNANTCTATASAVVTVNPIPTAAINGPTTICAGLPATLTASGGGTYNWSNSLGSNAGITVSPTQTTTYTVTVTGAGNCTATATQTVSVQAAPTAVVTGNSTICSGESTTLTANGGNTYTWGNGLGSNAAITVSPLATTTYNVTVSIGANCSATATKTVTVNQPNGSIVSETICFGTSFAFGGNTLTAGGVYRDTLQNVLGCDSVVTLNLSIRPLAEQTINEDICLGQSYSFNGQQLTQAGQYFDTLLTTAGCDSFIVLNLAIVSQITATVDAAICIGDSYSFDGQQLTIADAYTATFVSAGGCDSVVTLNLSVLPLAQSAFSAAVCDGDAYAFNGALLSQAGQYFDTLQTTAGCDSIITLNLTVNALPQPVATAAGNVLSVPTFDTYQWQLNGTDIIGADSQEYTATQNGDYTVVVSNASGCENTSATVTVTGVGINAIANITAKFYPNPVENTLNIALSGNTTTSTVTITNAAGARVLQTTMVGSNASIDLSGIAAGLLHIQVINAQGTMHTKLVKLD